MTSKEALYKLEKSTNWSSDENIDKDLYNLWENVACRSIKKDLEVLDILKRHSTMLDDEDWNTNIFNGIDYEDLDEKETKIIKEWLESEKGNI